MGTKLDYYLGHKYLHPVDIYLTLIFCLESSVCNLPYIGFYAPGLLIKLNVSNLCDYKHRVIIFILCGIIRPP